MCTLTTPRFFLAFFAILLFTGLVVGGVWAQDGPSKDGEETLNDQAGDDPGNDELEDEAAAAPQAAPVEHKVVHLELDSIIHPAAAEQVVAALKYADKMGAEALVLELNTPGGLLPSTREIYKAMLGARTPVVVFVGPQGAQAASAGFFVLMAADIAAMAPGTNTGAAHPVGGQGEDIEGHMGEKVEQDAAASIRSLARQHGRNIELAEAAVIESRSFTADEALDNGLIDLIAADVPALLRQIDGRTVEKLGEGAVILATADAEVEQRQPTTAQRFLGAISHPEIAVLLMGLGMLGLYVEITNPGLIFPGVLGAICLVLGLYALSVLPVSYAGVALILLAFGLFIAEPFVPTFGLLTAGGVVSLVLGGIMLFKNADPALRLELRWLLGLTFAMLLVIVPLTVQSIRMQRTRAQTGAEGLVHERGVARSALTPRGKVFVHGELWNAESETPVAAGSPVEVLAVNGLSLRVRAVSPPATDAV